MNAKEAREAQAASILAGAIGKAQRGEPWTDDHPAEAVRLILDAAEARTREMIEEAMGRRAHAQGCYYSGTEADMGPLPCPGCGVVLTEVKPAPAKPDTPPPFKPGDPVWWRTTMGAESTATVTSDPWHDSIGWIVRIRHELNDEFAIYTSRLRPRTVDAPAVAPDAGEDDALRAVIAVYRSGTNTPAQDAEIIRAYGNRRAAEALQAAVRELDPGPYVRGTYADGFATAVDRLRAIAARGGKGDTST